MAARLRRRCLLTGCLTVIVVLAASLWLPRTYRVVAVLDREIDMPATAHVDAGEHGASMRDAWTHEPRLINELIDTATARQVARQLASENPDAAFRHLYQHVHVHPIAIAPGGSHASSLMRLHLTYTGPDPLLGQRLVNAIAQQYIIQQYHRQPNAAQAELAASSESSQASQAASADPSARWDSPDKAITLTPLQQVQASHRSMLDMASAQCARSNMKLRQRWHHFSAIKQPQPPGLNNSITNSHIRPSNSRGRCWRPTRNSPPSKRSASNSRTWSIVLS